MFADAELILYSFLVPNYSDFCLIEVTVSYPRFEGENYITYVHCEWHVGEILRWSRMFWQFSPFKYGWSSWKMIHAGCPSMSPMSTGILCSFFLIDRTVTHEGVAEVDIYYVWCMSNCFNSRHGNENLSRFIPHILTKPSEWFLG